MDFTSEITTVLFYPFYKLEYCGLGLLRDLSSRAQGLPFLLWRGGPGHGSWLRAGLPLRLGRKEPFSEEEWLLPQFCLGSCSSWFVTAPQALPGHLEQASQLLAVPMGLPRALPAGISSNRLAHTRESVLGAGE
jgi:hypothetical protein